MAAMYPIKEKALLAASATTVGLSGAIVVMAMLLSVGSPQTGSTHPTNCADKLDELRVIVNIANATGRLPGSLYPAPVGSHFSVPPGLCNLSLSSFELPSAATAEDLQPTNSNLQPTRNAHVTQGNSQIVQGNKRDGVSLQPAGGFDEKSNQPY